MSSAALPEDEQKETDGGRLNWPWELGTCPVGLLFAVSSYIHSHIAVKQSQSREG